MKNFSRLIIRIFFVTLSIWSFNSCSKDQDLSNLDETIYVRHKDADMPAYIHGNGSEKIFLILLHGGPGGLGLVYRGMTIKSDIEKACAVVYFDQRGSGMSQGSYSENGISIDIMAEDVLALVNVLKHKYGKDSRFFLMGHSWGGTLGTATLLKDQSEFKGWIEVDGAHNWAGMYQEYKLNFQRVATEQIELGNNVDYWENILELVNEVAENYNQNDFFRLNIAAFEAEEKLADDQVIFKTNSEDNTDIILQYNLITAQWNRQNTLSILIGGQGILNSLSYTDRLSEITIPSLVISGKHDMVVPVSFAQEAYENLGSRMKKLSIFEQSGHVPFVNESNLFAAEVIQFINEHK